MQDWLNRYIEAVTRRYSPLAWDVVNEAIADNGALRGTLWGQIENYPKKAFDAARKHSDAPLFYCDFGVRHTTKWQAIFKLCEEVGSHGIGIQFRYNSAIALGLLPRLIEVTQHALSLGYLVHWSEVEITGVGNQLIYQRLIEEANRLGITHFCYWNSQHYDPAITCLTQLVPSSDTQDSLVPESV